MADFAKVFAELKEIMLPYAQQLDCKIDCEDQIYVDTKYQMKNGKPLWFGGVQIKKSYVSYHLMPIYVNPKLLEGISPDLRKRMRGKSCFNFFSSDESLFSELAALTGAGFRDYKKQGYV